MDRLRKENEALRKQVKDGRRPSGLVTTIAVILLMLFCLVTVGAALASWLHYTALDTPRFVEAIAPLIKDPAVARAVSEEAVDRLFARYDLADRIEKEIKSLPEPFKSQASTGSEGARTLAVAVATDVLKSNAFQTAWRAILTEAHEEAVAGLRASGAVRLNEQGEIILDITDLLTDIKDRLSSIGLGFLKDTKIPAGLGQVVLYQNSQLGKVKTAANTLDDLFLVLPLGAVILLMLGAMVSFDTRRAMMGASIGLVLLLGATYVVIEVMQYHFINPIHNTTTRSAANAIANHLQANLDVVLLGLVLLGALTVVAAVLSGPYTWATRVHEVVSLRGIRLRKDPQAAKREGMFSKFAWPVRIGGLCIALLLLLYLPSAAVVLTAIICGAYLLFLLVIEFLR